MRWYWATWKRCKKADNRFTGLVIVPRPGRAIQLGFGWDDEQPLRPWPTVLTHPNRSGHDRWCLCWCGIVLHVVTKKTDRL